MNIARCMLRKCEQCRYEQSCFRKDVENENNLQKNRRNLDIKKVLKLS